MNILFLYGWQSVPVGVKPTYLRSHGHQVINPALTDEDFGEAVRLAQTEFGYDAFVGLAAGNCLEN